jgi:hypothetical protein
MSSQSFQDKELEILRKAVDVAEKKQKGRTDKSLEIPDYDFFSKSALQDAHKLADIYYNEGYDDVEAKSGAHPGTFKVFVNFIPVADITYLDSEIFNNLKKEQIIVNKIAYAPPNFLRMSMFLELSRPDGDISRWEKVLKRKTLLDKNYPLKNKKCDTIEFQRSFEGEDKNNSIYKTTKNTLIKSGAVFFGGFAESVYSNYMPKKLQLQLKEVPDFDVLVNDPETTINNLRSNFKLIGKQIKVVKHPPIGELIDNHYEILIGDETIAFIYKPNACHSYNVITQKNKKIKIATIDTMLSFYLAFLYSNRQYYDFDRIICMAQYLFKVQQENRLKQDGVLKRFSTTCIGKQKGLNDIRKEKADKYDELKDKKGTVEYETYFLKYAPGDKKKTKKTKKTSKHKKQKSKSKTKKWKLIEW